MSKQHQHLLFVVAVLIFSPVYTFMHLDEGLVAAFAQSIGAFVVLFVCACIVLALGQALLFSILGTKPLPKSVARRTI